MLAKRHHYAWAMIFFTEVLNKKISDIFPTPYMTIMFGSLSWCSPQWHCPCATPCRLSIWAAVNGDGNDDDDDAGHEDVDDDDDKDDDNADHDDDGDG